MNENSKTQRCESASLRAYRRRGAGSANDDYAARRRVAVLTPIEAARKLYPQKARSFADLRLSFPGGVEFERNASPPRDVDL